MAVQYTDLVNKSGTIYNAKTGAGYSNPDQLAADLGVKSSAINWGGIKADPNWSFSTPSAPSAPTPAPAQTFSFMDNKAYDINQNQVTNSSTPVDNAVKNLGSDIQKSSSKTPDITSLLESFKVNDDNSAKKSEELSKLYGDRLKLLDERRQAEMERLNAEYGNEKLSKEADYQEAIKPFQDRLQRLKDTPYGPNATLEEDLKLKLAGLEKSHKLEMDTLFNRRQSSIALAQSAYEDKDFALSESMIKNAKDSEQEMYNRSQDYYNMVLKAQEDERAVQKAEYERTKQQMEFMSENGITEPFYEISGTVYRSSDNKPYSSIEQAKADGVDTEKWGNVSTVNPGAESERKIVASWAEKYVDSGISPSDSLATAQQKLQYSKIYQNSVRLVGSRSGNSDLFKFGSDAKSRLLSSGLTSDEIVNIQTNLNNGVSIDEILAASEFNDTQQKKIKDVMQGVTPTQEIKQSSGEKFLSSEWFWQNYTREQLIEAAKNDGITKDVSWGKDVGDPDAYINAMMAKIARDRSSGMSDEDIYKKYF